MKMSIPIVLTAVFIVLKLTEVITWSWLWVLSPLWIGAIAWLVAVLAMIVVVVLAGK